MTTTLRVATLATLLLLLAPPTLAHTQAITDAAGDESARPFAFLDDFATVHTADCKSPAADIRLLSVEVEDTTVVLRMELASLDDLAFSCDAFVELRGFEGNSASYTFRLESTASDALGEFQYAAITARAITTGFGIVGCVEPGFVDGFTDECVGDAVKEGDAIVWRAPLAGTVVAQISDDASGVTTHEETRSYDLAGGTYGVDADSLLEAVGALQFGLDIQDSANAEVGSVVL